MILQLLRTGKTYLLAHRYYPAISILWPLQSSKPSPPKHKCSKNSRNQATTRHHSAASKVVLVTPKKPDLYRLWMCAKPPWNGLKLALVVLESRTHTSQTRVHRTRLRFPCSELPPLWVPNLGGKRNVLFSSTFSLHRNSGLIFGHNFGLIKLTSRFLLASHASRRATTHFTTMAMQWWEKFWSETPYHCRHSRF